MTELPPERPPPSFIHTEFDYPNVPDEPPRRLSRLAVMTFVVSLLTSPVSVLGLMQGFHEYQRGAVGEDADTTAAAMAACVLGAVIGVVFPAVALTRLAGSPDVRGAGWAVAALLVSLVGWGMCLLLAFNLPPVGGLGH